MMVRATPWDGTDDGYETVLRQRDRDEQRALDRNRRVLRYNGGITDSAKTLALHPRYLFRTPWMGGPDTQDHRADPGVAADSGW